MENLIDISPDEMVRKIIGKNKIKYTTLTNLIDGNIHDLKSFVINIDSILIDLHKFFNKNKDADSDNLVFVIASSLINIVAHYRYYFSINNWYPNIYLLGDKNDSSKNISTAMELVRVVLKYVDNAYFIDTSKLTTGIIIKYFLKKKSENLILSRDEFDMMHISENTFFIKSNKDKSKLYSCDNWQRIMCGDNYNDSYNAVSYKLINMVLCFSGAHGRPGVKGLGFRTMLKKLSSAIENKNIVNGFYSDIHDFISDMGRAFNKYDLDKAESNFKIYDINSNYDKCITKAIEKRLDNCIEDRFSKKDLSMLNIKYFTGVDYLMLEELMTKPNSMRDISMKW